ncbi:MAG TPA: AraC family transcriptional regulator [Allosphingosinicella sp.]|nr:AraC family transcriptional regulator [Allosphingosinicella sp.]
MEVALSVGLDPYEMLKRAKISRAALSDTENRHSADAVVELLEESGLRSACESFGLLMAESRTFADLGPLSLLLQHVFTVGDVVRALIQYRRLMNDIITLECEEGGETSVIRWIIAPGYNRPQVVDLVMAVGYRVLSASSAGRWAADTAHFVHAAPSDLKAFRRIFGIRLEFNSAFNGYSCSREALQCRTVAPGAKMAGNARRLLSLVPPPSDAVPATDRVRHALAVLIPLGRATLTAVSADLGASPRTLQRLLILEGSNFASLLNEARKDLARYYLVASSHRVGVIAELLGYASTGSFSRWFVSQFGRPPLGWRQTDAKAAQPKNSESAAQETGLADEFPRYFRASPADF